MGNDVPRSLLINKASELSLNFSLLSFMLHVPTMSRIFRRFASTAGNNSASEAAAEILQRFGDKPISVKEQLIDSNQARLFSLVFGRPHLQENGRLTPDGAPADGTPLPAGYHFAYFTPQFLEKDLG